MNPAECTAIPEGTIRFLDSLRESADKLSSLFDAMTEMVVLHELIFNPQGNPVDYRIIDFNQAYTQIIGISKEAAIGPASTSTFASAV